MRLETIFWLESEGLGRGKEGFSETRSWPDFSYDFSSLNPGVQGMFQFILIAPVFKDAAIGSYSRDIETFVNIFPNR
jgi:hypothetical protein